MKNTPIIDIQKKCEWALHADNVIIKFPQSEHTNFTLKWMEITQRVDNVNELITELFNIFQLFHSKLNDDAIADSILKTPMLYKQKFLTEQIFYWIRKTIDELICMLYVLNYLKKNNTYPRKIKIDCIGKLLSSNNFIEGIKSRHDGFLQIINDISNTFKHSFLNSEIHAHIGEIDPLAFSYGFKNNDLDRVVIFTQYKVEDIIISLNVFLNDIIIFLKEIE